MKIPNTPKATFVRYSPEASPICPIGNDTLEGYFIIAYYPDGYLLEYMEFEEWLSKEVTGKRLTVEEATRLTFDRVSGLLGDIPLSVSYSAWSSVHAPVDVQISNERWEQKCGNLLGP